MLIGGFQKCSLIDYPDKISAIVFTLGCNLRCFYCHNPELVYPELFEKPIPEEEIFSFLTKRTGKLDAVTITGGEPTLQEDLLDFILKIKKLDFLVKLDSNGSNPDILENVISSKAIDYIAMDVKAPLGKYQGITNSNIDPERIKRSIELIMGSKIDYEFRTTVAKSEPDPSKNLLVIGLDEDDILKIGKLIRGARLCVLQKYVRPTNKLSKSMERDVPELRTYSDEELKKFQDIMTGFVEKCTIRV